MNRSIIIKAIVIIFALQAFAVITPFEGYDGMAVMAQKAKTAARKTTTSKG